MRVYISPSNAYGAIQAISSKSMLHRLLICSAFCSQPTNIICTNTCDDIEATIGCLEKLGAQITQTYDGYRVVPIPHDNDDVFHYLPHRNQILNAGKSGTTLRFMTAILAALDVPNKIDADSQLQARPMKELIDELIIAGADINSDNHYPLSISGSMRAGRYILPGNISSQYISALLLASPLLKGNSEIVAQLPVESQSYIDLTIEAMAKFGIEVITSKNEHEIIYTVHNDHYQSPGEVICEGDWSQASTWLALGSISTDVVGIEGLNMRSVQPDRAIMGALSIMGARAMRKTNEVYVRKDQMRPLNIDCSGCPDLTPALALMASVIPHTSKLRGLNRLKYKESNRIDAIVYTLESFGITCEFDDSSIIIHGGEIRAPKHVLNPFDDHRICMLQALLATKADGVCAIDNCEVVAKSYPSFFEDMAPLDLALRLEE